MRSWKPLAMGLAMLAAGTLIAGCSLGGRLRAMRKDIPEAKVEVSTGQSPVAPQQSQLAVQPSQLAPKPSVSIPEASLSELGKPKPRFASIRSAWSKTRDALTFKPRVIPAKDPIKLDNQPEAIGAPVYVAAARVYEGQGRADRAKEQYAMALAASPNDLAALVGLARLHQRQNDIAEATQTYQTAIKHHPTAALAHNDLGLCFARQNMPQPAEHHLREAVRLEPRSRLYCNNLAVLLVEADKIDEAFGILASVHGPAVANYNLGYMLSEKGEHQYAGQFLRAALRHDPNMAPAQQLLASMQQAPRSRQYQTADARSDRNPANGIRQAQRPPQDIRRMPPAEGYPQRY